MRAMKGQDMRAAKTAMKRFWGWFGLDGDKITGDRADIIKKSLDLSAALVKLRGTDRATRKAGQMFCRDCVDFKVHCFVDTPLEDCKDEVGCSDCFRRKPKAPTPTDGPVWREYPTPSGRPAKVNISDKALAPFGFRHGDKAVNPLGRTVEIIGVGDNPTTDDKGKLWEREIDSTLILWRSDPSKLTKLLPPASLVYTGITAPATPRLKDGPALCAESAHCADCLHLSRACRFEGSHVNPPCSEKEKNPNFTAPKTTAPGSVVVGGNI